MTICRNCNKTAHFNTPDEKKRKYCYQKDCMKNNDNFNIFLKKRKCK